MDLVFKTCGVAPRERPGGFDSHALPPPRVSVAAVSAAAGSPAQDPSDQIAARLDDRESPRDVQADVAPAQRAVDRLRRRVVDRPRVEGQIRRRGQGERDENQGELHHEAPA